MKRKPPNSPRMMQMNPHELSAKEILGLQIAMLMESYTQYLIINGMLPLILIFGDKEGTQTGMVTTDCIDSNEAREILDKHYKMTYNDPSLVVPREMIEVTVDEDPKG